MARPVPKDDQRNTADHRWMESVNREARTTAATVAGKASATQTWSQSFLFEAPEDGDYRVEVNAAIARSITSVTTRSAAGTATLTVKIDTTALGGTANSVSTSEQTQTHSSANSLPVGGDIVFTLSSVSGVEKMSVTLSGSVTLDA